MSLDIGAVTGPGQEAETTVHATWDTFDEVELELSQIGIHPLEQPKEALPVVTTDVLTTMNSDNYADVGNRLRAWHEYISNVNARVRSCVLQIENEMDHISTFVKQSMVEAVKAEGKTKKPSDADIKHAIKLQPRYQALQLEHQKYKQKAMLLESRLEGLDKSIKMMSRNLERKRQDLEANYGAGGIRRPVPPPQGYGGYGS